MNSKIARKVYWVGKLRGGDVIQSWQRNQTQQAKAHRVDGLRDGQDSERVEQPMPNKNHKVPRVADAPAEEGPGRLVELEGKVRGRGENGENEDDVGVRHVDEAARHGVRYC